jgi:hypothetical protein
MMRLGPIPLLDLPDRAGEYQRLQATPALIAELGDNYNKYHAFLVEQLAALGGRPRCADFDDPEAFLEAFGRAQRIVYAESLLRRCRAYRRTRHPMDAVPQEQIPLLDADDKLVFAA